MMTNTLEIILDEIKQHDIEHPDHGEGCACHDKHAGMIRRLVAEKQLPRKSLSNFLIIIGYFQRNP